MKKLNLFAALLTAGFISFATVSCGEMKPSAGGDSTQPGGNGGNGGETTGTPSFDNLNGAITITKVNELLDGMGDDKESDKSYYIYGKVVSEPHTKFGTCTLQDLTDSTKKLTLWGSKDKFNALTTKYAEGDQVLVYGKIKKYIDDGVEKRKVHQPDIIEVKKA